MMMATDHRQPSLAAGIVLAAGLGTRMRPLSEVLPKPALPLPTGPAISSCLELARRYCSRVVVNSHHLAPLLEHAVQDCLHGSARVAFSRESDLMNTGGGLALARDRGLLGTDGDVLVINGDCVLSLDLEELIAQHHARDHLVTLALLPHLDPSRWSRITLDDAGRVVSIRPAGPFAAGEVPFLYTGAMIVARELLNSLPNEACTIQNRLWDPAKSKGRLGGAVVTGHWREVGTPAAYLDAVVSMLHGEPRVAPTARVSHHAILGTAFIGRDSRIAPKALIAESIVSHGASIGEGARVIRSVVLGPVMIEPGATVVDDLRTAPITYP